MGRLVPDQVGSGQVSSVQFNKQFSLAYLFRFKLFLFFLVSESLSVLSN